MPADEEPIQIHEIVTLRKFDGDPPQPGEAKEPVETLVLRDGMIVEHIIKEDTHGPV